MASGWNRQAQRRCWSSVFTTPAGCEDSRILSGQSPSKYELRKNHYETQTCCSVVRAPLRGSACSDDYTSDRVLDRTWRSRVLQPRAVVLESWRALVLGPGPLGLASPSSHLGSRLLRAPTALVSLTVTAEGPDGASVFNGCLPLHGDVAMKWRSTETRSYFTYENDPHCCFAGLRFLWRSLFPLG
jgi:hypothetical protein